MNLSKKTISTYTAITLITLGCFNFSSCLKKGEEDPFISLRTRKVRITGEWKVTKYIVNGTDALNYSSSSTYYSSSCQSNYTITSSSASTMKMEFEKDDDFEMFYTYSSSSKYDYVSEIYCSDYTSQGFTYNGTSFGKWEFDDGKKELEITVDSQRQTYDIIKLSNSEMILEGIIDGDKYEIELEKD